MNLLIRIAYALTLGALTLLTACGGNAFSPPSSATPPGAAAGGITPSTTALTFGGVLEKRQSTSSVVLTSADSVTAQVSTSVVGVNAGDFSVSGCTKLPAKATCSLSVTFHPWSAGPRSAALIVSVNGSAGLTIKLSGAGEFATVVEPNYVAGELSVVDPETGSGAEYPFASLGLAGVNSIVDDQANAQVFLLGIDSNDQWIMVCVSRMTGAVLGTVSVPQSIQRIFDAVQGEAIAIGWDAETGRNELLKVDPQTGNASVLNQFILNSGNWSGAALDPETSTVYVSDISSLYSFSLSSGQPGQVVSLAVTDLQEITIGPSGTLIGLCSHDGSPARMVRIEPSNGTVSDLNDSALAWWYPGSLASDQATGQVYALSPDVTGGADLNVFDPTSGVLESSVLLK